MDKNFIGEILFLLRRFFFHYLNFYNKKMFVTIQTCPKF